MLRTLQFTDVGPGPSLAMEFKQRLNLLVGDNGLGKTFLLDAAWWALTRTWARGLIVPRPVPAKPKISFSYSKVTPGLYEYRSTFDREVDQWRVQRGRPAIPGLILYAQVDGGFSVWDPARNYWKKDAPERPNAFLFTSPEVWKGNKHCEGLIRDWASWQRENGAPFKNLKSVLRALSPSEEELLEPGKLRKLFLDDPLRYPTLKMPYGEEVAVIHASAGMRRVIGLAYLLVWCWQEHLAASAHTGKPPAREIVFLIDEIDAHLHPKWQRRIVPSLLSVMEAMDSDETLAASQAMAVQLIAATHSPLVLASAEPAFEEDLDGVFHLDLRDGQVHLEELQWSKQGDVVNWLVSETFGLRQGRSLQAEKAIEAAEAWMRGDTAALPQGLTTKEAIHKELVRLLPGHDPFWPRWVVKTEQQGAKG